MKLHKRWLEMSARLGLLIILSAAVWLSPLESAAKAAPAPSGAPDSREAYLPQQRGELRPDGFYSLGTLRSIAPPQKAEYLSATLIIKTRDYHYVPDGAREFPSLLIQSSLEALDVQLIVTLFPAYNRSDLLRADVHGIGRLYRLHYAAETDAWEAAQLLNANPAIEYAEPVYMRYPDLRPNDPFFNQEYHLQRIRAELAWDISRGNSNVVIAIIDSGTDYQHEDLADNIWTNGQEVAGNGRDDDNNGFVDDIRGWDFVGSVSPAQIAAGQFAPDNDARVGGGSAEWRADPRGHGTVVAGAASAVSDNGRGIASSGFGCRIIPIKCGSDNIQVTGVFRGYEAILYAAQLGADIINCSWGGFTRMQSEQDIINEAVDLGALIVASSGNEGLMSDLELAHYPSNYDNVLSVGATNQNDDATSFSNYGIGTKVYAPGAAIISTTPANTYSVQAGTSFSAPIVAGIAGLVKTIHPNWTPLQLLHQIRSSADNVVSPSVAERPWYYGRANAERALLVNRNLASGDRVPGIGIKELGIDSESGFLDDFEPTTVRLTLQNYLARASSLRVSFRSLDGYLDFSSAEVNAGSLNTMDERTVDVELQLTANSPWLTGFADVLVTFESGSYLDFARIQIPIDIESDNSWGTAPLPASVIRDLPQTTWRSSSAPSASSFWASGSTVDVASGRELGIVQRSSNIGLQALRVGAGQFSANPSYAIHGRSTTEAYAGSNRPEGGGAVILKTTNGGGNWRSVSISSITGFINDIHFFDQQSGIVLGDPLGNRWGVGRSDDAGVSWTALTNLPSPQAGETGLAGSSCWLDDNGWFGTTTGRVFRSSNRGASWSASVLRNGAIIIDLAFTTPDLGIAIYRMGTNPDAPNLVATSSDGGRNWETGRYDLSDDFLNVAFAHGPAQGRDHFVIGDLGQIFATGDHGESFRPMLAPRIGAASTGDGIVGNNRIRIWRMHMVGASWTDIDFAAIPDPRKTEVSSQLLFFGSVRQKETGRQTLEISSTGTEAVTLASTIELRDADDGEFTLEEPLPATLDPGATISVTVLFSPQVSAQRIARLNIESDGGNYSITLRGLGTDAVETGVAESDAGSLRLLPVFPHPVQGSAQLAFELAAPAYTEVVLLDALGRKLKQLFSGQAPAGATNVTLTRGELPPGLYAIRLNSGGATLTQSVMLLH